MRVIVVHEDGDRRDRVNELLASIVVCVQDGTMRYQGVGIELRTDTELREAATVSDDELVFTTEDLLTLQRFARIARKMADKGSPELKPGAGRAVVEFAQRYMAEFVETIVNKLAAAKAREAANNDASR